MNGGRRPQARRLRGLTEDRSSASEGARMLVRAVISGFATAVASAQTPVFGVLDGPIPVAALPVEAVGDLDADGDADVVGQNAVAVNDGHGRFLAAASNLTFPVVVPVIADLNNDSLRDVASHRFLDRSERRSDRIQPGRTVVLGSGRSTSEHS